MPTPISAIVLTKNEEEDLPDCLASLDWADEILVVDSFSTDATMDIAGRMATRVIQHPFKNFAAQHNFAQSQTEHDWVLFVDADERVSTELRDEICTLARTDRLAACNAYHFQRVHLFSGRWMPDVSNRKMTPAVQQSIMQNEVPRLFNRNLAKWERPLHEEVRVPPPHGALAGVLYHYSGTNLSRIHANLNYYSDLEAAHLACTRTRASLIEAVARGVRSFVFHYFYRGLYRMGDQGFLLASFYSYSKFLMYAKLSERARIQRKQGVWTERDHRMLQQLDAVVRDDNTGGE